MKRAYLVNPSIVPPSPPLCATAVEVVDRYVFGRYNRTGCRLHAGASGAIAEHPLSRRGVSRQGASLSRSSIAYPTESHAYLTQPSAKFLLRKVIAC